MKVAAIMNGMRDKNHQLSMKVTEMEDLSEKKALAEREYRKAYATKVFELTHAGTAVTVAKTLAKGDKAVADLKYEFDVAKGIYDACREQISALNTAIDTYRSLLSWNKMEYEKSGIGH